MRKMSDIVRNQNPLMLPPDATVMQAATAASARFW
jgi:hypothetical protein